MAKERGFAVVSGSSTVVARIMENGTVRFGEDMAVTGAYSGTLVLNLPSGQGDGRVVQVDSSNSASLAQLSASQIALNDGMSTNFGGNTDVSGALVFLSSSINSLGAQSNLDVSASNGSGSIVFANEVFSILGTTNQTVTSYDEGTNTLTVGLTDSVFLSGSLTASTGVLVNGGGVTATGNISGSGDLLVGATTTLGGNLTVNGASNTVNGSLTVTGDLLVSGSTVTLNVENLLVEDPLILVGSGNVGTSLDEGLIFQRGGDGNKGFIWDETADEFALIDTDETGTTAGNVVINSYVKLHIGALTGSSGEFAGNLDVDGNTTLNTLTSSNGIEVTAGPLTFPNSSLVGLSSSGGQLLVNYGAVANTAVQGNTQVTFSGVSGEIEIVSGSPLTLGSGGTVQIGLPDNVTISGDLIVSGNTTLGTNQLDTITVVGNLRHPIFTVSGANNVPTFPIVPDEYISNASIYSGFSFYLTSSAAATNGITPGSGSILTVGNKWYFNENGEWHPSFFYSV